MYQWIMLHPVCCDKARNMTVSVWAFPMGIPHGDSPWGIPMGIPHGDSPSGSPLG